MFKFLIFIFALFIMFLVLGVYLLKRVKNAIFSMFNANEKVMQSRVQSEEKEILYKSGDTVILKGEAKHSDEHHS